MIRRFLERLLPGNAKGGKPRIYGPEDHPIRREQLSRGALQVTARLAEAGFKAYVVGGAVRDLLLGITPKDFDIATDALPEQVKPLFRRAYIIGRRFRLVHVHVGPEPIEVSTFRAAQTGDDATDEHGRLLSDNVYGSQAEDAVRRDFTINALYFDPLREELHDPCGGLADLAAGRQRHASPRFGVDPLRVLRAMQFAARFDFELAEETVALCSTLSSAGLARERVFGEWRKLGARILGFTELDNN